MLSIKTSGGFFGGSPWGLWGHHHWGSCGQEEGGEEETEQDLDVVCANYVTAEPQVWEELGVTPDKISEVPQDLVTMEFSSGTIMLHENRYLSTERVRCEPQPKNQTIKFHETFPGS